jgi:hypothetical protein
VLSVSLVVGIGTPPTPLAAGECAPPPFGPGGRAHSSNGNDIETKQNDISIIGVFSVSKRSESTYSRTCKDRSEAKTITLILCRIEEITNILVQN